MGGIVDGRAYSILACVNNAGGSKYDLIKVRNPWDQGEFASGMWDDDGLGWDKYPAVKAACKPTKANDGVFWLDVDEFFKYFPTIYLCAHDMSLFCGGSGVGNIASRRGSIAHEACNKLHFNPGSRA